MVASKLPQILNLEPANELEFQGPFDKVVTSFLELKNPSDKRICFKVKTTAPRRYCVRPNSGIVDPDGKVRIAIMLQPMELDSYGERNKHKFMVQSIIVPRENDGGSFDEIWQSASQEQIMDSKLKCKFTESVESESQQIDTSTPDVIGPIKLTSTPAANKQTSPSASAGKLATSQQEQKQPQQQRQSSFTEKSSRLQQHHQLSSSFHDSFHNAISDDKKMVLVSFLMLILGVVLGKYII